MEKLQLYMEAEMGEKIRQIILFGAPNVGKSMIFNYLTGSYVIVSNYPGTTVDVARGKGVIGSQSYEIIDTPGVYSLSPLTDEEQVAVNLLRKSKKSLVIHIIDAKNIRRMLPLTLQLIDGGFPLLLVLNIIDEAERLGLYIYTERLSQILGIPVIATSAVQNRGLQLLKKAISTYCYSKPHPVEFSNETEKVISAVEMLLAHDYGFHKRLTATLILQKDAFALDLSKDEDCYFEIKKLEQLYYRETGDRLAQGMIAERQMIVDNIIRETVYSSDKNRKIRLKWLDRVTCHPILGLPILMAVVYIGLYQFVGRFGAGFLVDFMNHGLFGTIIEPAFSRIVEQYIPWEWCRSILVGEYGLFSLGIRYAVAIILPIVGAFFVAFALLEDCGYLPRLAMLTDRFLKNIGLNGRAVIPLMLGFGCGTMAVMATRTLETWRERMIATLLLALAVPCSAQLGLVLSLLSHNSQALLLWAGCVSVVFFISGCLSAKLIGSSGSAFYMELPPLRIPVISNVIKKACFRMVWYFIEILPVFIGTSFLLWAADRSGLLNKIITVIEYPLQYLDLPADCAQVFLLGFFRRDYGAAGLYDLANSGRLTDHQLLVAAVVLTLFMPCVAQLSVMIKERGWFSSLLMSLVITLVALLTGWLVNKGVSWLCLM